MRYYVAEWIEQPRAVEVWQVCALPVACSVVNDCAVGKGEMRQPARVRRSIALLRMTDDDNARSRCNHGNFSAQAHALLVAASIAAAYGHPELPIRQQRARNDLKRQDRLYTFENRQDQGVGHVSADCVLLCVPPSSV